jgi:hypothetical protein
MTVRIKWIALAVAGALMTIPAPASALNSAPLTVKKERKPRTKRERGFAPVAVSPALQAIAVCESGGNPRAVSANGMYRGKYQFDYGTWAAVGGSGDPAAASEAEQDARAATLYARAGSSPWPVCGR